MVFSPCCCCHLYEKMKWLDTCKMPKCCFEPQVKIENTLWCHPSLFFSVGPSGTAAHRLLSPCEKVKNQYLSWQQSPLFFPQVLPNYKMIISNLFFLPSSFKALDIIIWQACVIVPAPPLPPLDTVCGFLDLWYNHSLGTILPGHWQSRPACRL